MLLVLYQDGGGQQQPHLPVLDVLQS